MSEQMTMYQLKEDAVEELIEHLNAALASGDIDPEDPERSYDPDDWIFESADGWVPIYNSDIMDLASSDYDIMLTEPEFELTENTPVAVAQANIFTALRKAMYEAHRDWCSEIEDEWATFLEDWLYQMKVEAEGLAIEYTDVPDEDEMDSTFEPHVTRIFQQCVDDAADDDDSPERWGKKDDIIEMGVETLKEILVDIIESRDGEEE